MMMGKFDIKMPDTLFFQLDSILDSQSQRELTESEKLALLAQFEQSLREWDVKYRELADLLPQIVYEVDITGKVNFFNQAAQLILGYTKDEVEGRINAFELLIPQDRQRAMDNFARVVKGLDKSIGNEYTMYKKDGSTLPVLIYADAIIRDNRTIGSRGIIVDISDRKETELALQESEEKFRTLFESSQNAIILFDLERGIFDCNQTTVKLFGYSRKEEVLGTFPWSLAPTSQPDGGESVERAREQMQIVLDKGSHSFEWQHQRRDGSLFPAHVQVSKFTISGRQVIQATIQDVTLRKAAEAHIRYLSYYDKLTGLHNRAYMEEKMKSMTELELLPLSLIVGDTNGLKLVNDAFGHDQGDKLLQRIAGIMQDIFSPKHVVSRWGGDEFAVLLPETEAGEAFMLMEKVKQACAKAEPDPIQLSIALGCATKERPDQDIHEVLKNAEAQMYSNKLAQSSKFRNLLIASLIKKLGEKEYEHEFHTWRILSLAMKLGEAVGLDDNQLEDLILTVTLHDVGKLAISEQILVKREPITSQEWEILKKHSERGYHIVKSASELAHVAPFVLAHHERWDGTGYPQGLAGEKIPLISRILATVDAYEVMTNGRIYKGPISKEEAITELEEWAGTQFDPQLVELLVQIVANEDD